MNIDNLTIGELKEIATLLNTMEITPKKETASHSISKGVNVFVRTVTHYYTGKVEQITDSDIVLSEAAWIADTGRFSTALRTGELNEVEPYPDRVLICRGAIVDIAVWLHPLPREQK